MKFKLYEHQQKAVDKADNQKAFAYFAEMGTGKSVMLLADAERSFNRIEIDVLFIIAPKGVYLNWAIKEIPQHLSCQHEVYTWNSGLTDKQQERLWKDISWSSPKLKIILMNIEGLISKHSKKFAMRIVKEFQTMLVLDESTTIKNPGSKRTQACLDLADHAKFKRILTGSPITNSPFDMYAQARFLDVNFLGFTSFLSFKHFYADIFKVKTNSGAEFETIRGYKNLDQLNARIEPWSYRCLKKDCLDLPDKIYESFDVELTDEQRKAYNEMLTMWLVMVEEGTVTANLALTRLMKLHHILCGYVKKDDGTIVSFPNNRPKALLDVIELNPLAKTLIWANYRQDIKNIVEALSPVYGPKSIVEFYGETSDEDRNIAKVRFQEDPTCQFWIGTTKAGGRGNTLTAASAAIFYSYDYDRELRVQAEDRAHRIGQKNNLLITDLICRNTIDEVILRSHKTKEGLADEILGDARKTLKLL